MDINKILDTVMTFINEHTDILIGVCIFLILVLIGYLIDNSVKSKRVRKDIKNKDQVPENIKKDIIEEAIDNKEVSALSNDDNLEKVEEKQEVQEENLNSEQDIEVEKNDENILDTTEQTTNEFENFIIDNANPLNLNDDSSVPLDLDLNNNNDMSISIDLPDSNIENNISNEETSKYNNDLTLSEILFSQEQKDDVAPLNIDIVPSNVEENVSSNENTQIDDELDSIMKKLNNVNTIDMENEETDNYTNIF